MEQIIIKEFNEIARTFDDHAAKGENLCSELLFNLTMLNVIWGMINGKRYRRNANLMGINCSFY